MRNGIFTVYAPMYFSKSLTWVQAGISRATIALEPTALRIFYIWMALKHYIFPLFDHKSTYTLK